MSTSLEFMCTAQAIPYPIVFGTEFLSLTATVVSNYTAVAPAIYNYNHPDLVAENVNFCNITVSYTHPGVNDKVIVETWLPLEGWNERLQASGGGGLAAGRFFLSYWDMDGAISQGYAAVTTDAGLGSSSSWEPWALLSPGNPNIEIFQDFGSLSLNEQALIGKALVESFYGIPPKYSYFSGCSQGGRQGLMLAQRYPTAYNGIAASAPANNWDEFIMNIFYPTLIMQLLGEFPPPCEFDALRAAAIEFCDPLDGVTDGIVSSLYDCPFDPMSVVGKTISCATFGNATRRISKAAAITANATWTGARSANGSFLWYGVNYDADLSGDLTNSGYALDATLCSSNGTCTGSPSYLVTGWIQNFIEKNPDFDYTNMTHEQYDSIFHAGKQQFDSMYSANDPDLTEFKKAGGKMLTYHGLVTFHFNLIEQHYS
jgi:Tannase and feruloyl esterase